MTSCWETRFLDADRIKKAIALYQAQLVHYVIKFVGNRETAAEIVQEAFLRLWKTDVGKVPLASEKAWLYSVCRNLAIDSLRKHKRMVVSDQLDNLANPSDESDNLDEDQLTQILSVIEQLSDNQKEVLRLKYQHDMAYKEIAQVTGMTVSNVGATLHHAIKTVKKLLNAQEKETGGSA